MSDYLWDKTGEPDEDVERLENLLGTLRYQPRPLELPQAHASHARMPRAHFSARSVAAVAAALILMLLAGVWFGSHREANPQRSALNSNDTQHQQLMPQLAHSAQEKSPDSSAVTLPPRSLKDEGMVIRHAGFKQRHKLHLRSPDKSPQRSNETNEMRQRQEIAQDNATLTPQQQAAMAQLMLALRVTSAKLNYVQREISHADATQVIKER